MQVISWKAAKAAGLKYFFTGKPCKRGHIDKRFVSSTQCKTCSYERVLNIYHGRMPSITGRVCARCGVLIPEGRTRKARYCSLLCRTLVRRGKYTEDERRWKRENRDRIRVRTRERYASNEQSRQRTLERARESRIRCVDRVRREKRKSAQVRRARKKAVFVEVVDPMVVFQRDKGICGICMKHVDINSKWHIDHVIPIARGGVHSYANVQLAHALCNLSKHAKMPAARS